MPKKYLLLFIGSCLGGLTITAQESTLNPVTVSASLSRQRAAETGRNITIVPGDRFKDLPVHSLDELLRYVPGVEIQARGPMGSQSDIVLRGGTFQQVLVILDGMRLNDPNTGHFNSYIPIAPAEIERIEVLKGASSAIYGADAVGGVVYIITKSFAAKMGQTGTRITAGAHGGEYGLWGADAGIVYSHNKLHVAGGVIKNQADGVQQRGTTGYFNNTTASVSANYYLNAQWNVAYRFAYDTRDFAAQNYYTTFLSDTAKEKVTSRWHQLRIAYEGAKASFSFDAGYKSVTDRYAFNKLSPPNSSESKLFQSRLLYEYRPNKLTGLVAGVNFLEKKIASNDRGHHTLYQVSPFVSVSQKLWEGFTMRPSLQWVYFENISSELVPQLDLSQKIGSWQLRGSVGKTIRDADFTERYNNYNKALVTSGRVGNPDLRAERSVSYEAGADWFWKDKLKLSSTFFQRFHQRLIDYSTTAYADMPRKSNLSPTGTYALAKNIAEVNTTGFETDVQYIHDLGHGHKLTTGAGLVWLSSTSSDTTPSFYVSSHAKFLTNFSVIYEWKNLLISANGLYKKRQAQKAAAINAALSPDYFLANARVQYAFLHKMIAVFAQVDNLFDRQYSDLLGTPMPGRWFMGGVQLRWKNTGN
ncbi:TonB-dependent receptor [Paraflavitalea sp. CAU 1676]|uniref:TonB-dependent receptor plug domain-containing protein n=1 Tax=Paraflavitalea sp. CAU 1676 TaxID=3032598 RepID=UPI0023D9939A|nr:TonB-dependent receptor [Paraflavitalea sp. CAU 1676]MDF2193209.1 TonB-dependent receptor [Paraflavitalea sp. CAU 1676]